ncbi:NADH pyrophosphatase [Puccinia graminis f. sp. tritici]|uniref:NAD(+) diphosphatase n=1 Tax=Puccinia graminis f. sp. tritici TaxID=56615 RepID=A0A5B0QBF9_PUCGR|nr:NADH pyrophosphatase [Puccinia graminis f. sp. tritici]
MSEVRNYYSGGSTNRLSWMRQSGSFLGSALSSPQARYILFHNLKPLVIDQPSETIDGFPVSNKLSSLPWQEVALMLSPTGSAIVDPGEVVDPSGTMWPKQLASHSANARQPVLDQCPIIIFLGTDNSTEHPEVDKSLQPGHGSPVWAIDVTPIYERTSRTLLQHGRFLDMKKATLALKEANLAAQARALIDWNLRNKFCAACGRPTYSAWAGWKLACTSTLQVHGGTDDGDLATTSPGCVTNSFSIQNFCFPRTDPVCIMGITNSTGDSILLGRKSVWPPGFYSCLAGFIEPGESIEDCCRREVLEEAGVEVNSVTYHSSQPWPFPGSLMIGVMGRAAENPHIRLDLDKELEDAKFFPRSLILEVLDSSKKTELTEDELRRFDDNYKPSVTVDPVVTAQTSSSSKIHLTIPPPTAIAHQIIRSWAINDDQNDGKGKICERRSNY